MVAVLQFLYKLLDICLSAFGRRRAVRVLVHDATHIATERYCYFVNITNLSPTRDVEVTHVWFDDDARIPVFNDERPLPRRLKPDESWETWIPIGRIPSGLLSAAETKFRVRLSTSTIVKSRLNKDVPPIGYIPGGP